MANTYGDKAFKIAKMSSLTGKRWPIIGKRLHDDFPYLEAEVRVQNFLLTFTERQKFLLTFTERQSSDFRSFC